MSGIRFFGNGRARARIAILLLALTTVLNCEILTLAQQPDPQRSQLERKLEEQNQETPSDVVRVRTDLVQTSVAVFDKSGKFVDNLKAEDFELRVDGKPHPVQFFDRVVDGLAQGPSKTAARSLIAAPEDKTRTVMFFVDDIHLSAESMARARKMLSDYIEDQMGENDEVVITSASGQVGFLQQVTSEKEVLRAAIDRLKYRPQDTLDTDSPRMSPFQALAIQRGDANTLRYFMSVLLVNELSFLARNQPQLARDIAERRTLTRADRIARQHGFIATQTLNSLNRAVRSSAQVAGRKLVVFISDGFFINNQTADIRNHLQLIADAAVRTGAVLYTVQASGLNTTFADARSDAMLVSGVGNGQLAGEDTAAQDLLTQLAADTGGKALLNANDLTTGLKRALRESNDYYLLAWRPDKQVSAASDFRQIEVSVKGHPGLSILVQKGFLREDQRAAVVPTRTVTNTKAAGDFQVEDLAAAIAGKLTAAPLRTSITANYLDVPNRGARLSILMQVDRTAAQTGGDAKSAIVDIAGVIYDESGKMVQSFVDSLRPESADNQHVAYLNQFDVKPGLYQVRGAARDSSGATGMAMQWVKVPDLGNKTLTLSSLLVGERGINYTETTDSLQPDKAQLKIDKRFVSKSRLRFVTFIYNATRDASSTLRLNGRVDIFRGNKPVVSTPARVIETGGVSDPARLPYAGELSLASLPRGNYKMRVTVIDLNAKAFASQETAFAIQ